MSSSFSTATNEGGALFANPFGTKSQAAYPFGSCLIAPSPGGFVFTDASTGAASSPAFSNAAPSTPALAARLPLSAAVDHPNFVRIPCLDALANTQANPFGNSMAPTFGSTSTAMSCFGSGNTPAFGASTTCSAFGSSSTPTFEPTASTFGTPSTSAFGASSSPAFAASGISCFNFSSSPTFGQSRTTFGSTPFGSTNSAFGAQNSTFETRVANYTSTTETGTGSEPPGKLRVNVSIPVYKDKSHEELRWEDYQLGEKGGPAPPGGIGSNTTPPLSNAFSSSSQFGQTAANNLFGQNKSPFENSSPPVFTPSSNLFSSQATQPTEVNSGTQLPETLESISATPGYKDKSHEELRWRDYQLRHKGGGFWTTQNVFPSPFSSASTSTFPNSHLFRLGTSSSSAPSLFSWPRTQPPSAPSPFSFCSQTGNLLGQRNHPAFGSSGTSASGFFLSTPSTSSARTINVSISVDQLTTDLHLFVSLNGAAKCVD